MCVYEYFSRACVCMYKVHSPQLTFRSCQEAELGNPVTNTASEAIQVISNHTEHDNKGKFKPVERLRAIQIKTTHLDIPSAGEVHYGYCYCNCYSGQQMMTVLSHHVLFQPTKI